MKRTEIVWIVLFLLVMIDEMWWRNKSVTEARITANLVRQLTRDIGGRPLLAQYWHDESLKWEEFCYELTGKTNTILGRGLGQLTWTMDLNGNGVFANAWINTFDGGSTQRVGFFTNGQWAGYSFRPVRNTKIDIGPEPKNP